MSGSAHPCFPSKTSPSEEPAGSTVTVNLLTRYDTEADKFKGRLSANLEEAATDRSLRILATALALMAQADTK
jgi:hypothetical protein